MVPKGWKLTSLNEICEGNLQTGPFGSQLHAHEYESDGVPVLMPRDLVDCRADVSGASKISEERAQTLKKHILSKGDLLFSRRGDVTRFALIDEKSEGSICGTGCLKARPSTNHSSKFLAYFLQKDAVKKWLEQNAVGQTMPNMNTEILRELPLVSASSKEEEEKIATILSTWDKAISTTERLIDNSKQQKKALMQTLLTGKKRLLDDSGRPFEGEWVEVKLGDVCSKVTDGAHHSPQSVEVGYPMFSVKDMRSTGFSENTARHISEDDFKALEKQNCKPEINDILIAKDGSILKYCFVVKEEIEGVILSSIALLRPKLNKIYPHFIAQYFSQDSVKFFVGKALTSGSGVPRIILKDFKGIHIRIPSLYEQKKIASVLTNADQEIALLQQQLADLKQEKKALMQQLLTGKRRVLV
ncbi:MAG: restriction endonuclease subunit S [Marinomonas sp.]|jgi:type I restriction enzyme, S subunit|uniref:restriction endonuclease subunit S n=1 Tax=Marinomonas sp. TaxID=1904862 RepID=UPI003F9C5453